MNLTRFLILRLEGPLMSFGGVAVDQHGITLPFPTLSMVTGLLSNALGYGHGDTNLLERLQQRIRFGARRDRKGEHIIDYQTVDLGQDFLRGSWTTHDQPASRGGDKGNREGTHIRYRHYWADAIFTLAMTLEPADEPPDLDRLSVSLKEPERPLFLGRKSCLPSGPILTEEIDAPSIHEALTLARLSPRADQGALLASWPVDNAPQPDNQQGREIAVSDRRDWANQIHVGRRFVWEAPISPHEVDHGL